MLDYLRSEVQLIGIVLMWVVVSYFLGPVGYALLPLTLLLLKGREQYPDLLMGFLIVLVLSDMHIGVWYNNIFKNAKNIYIVLLAMFLFMERKSFAPFSQIFGIFLPFFIYSIFPLVFSSALVTGVQKTISYALLYLVVPNYVLRSFREQGWWFFRNLIFFMALILIAGFIFRFVSPGSVYVMDRFRGIFGNPNGVAMYSLLFFLLTSILNSMKPDLFTWKERIFIFGVIFYTLILSGSRASLAATFIYIGFNRFFAYSPLLGFIVLLAIVGISEVLSQNFEAIVSAVGLQDFFRLRTLEGGSGRYFAWEFAWEKIQDYLVFGGGFANDETIMRQNYKYLERMGHQGGVHNSYLSLWFDVGLVGILIYFRSFFLLFIKASKLAPMSLAAMFAVMFSINYESWLVGSLNPFTIIFLMIMTVLSEAEIAGWRPDAEVEETTEGPTTQVAVGAGT